MKDSTHQAAAKRLRREAMSRGNQQRQQTEAHAPRWANEPGGGKIGTMRDAFNKPKRGK